MDEKGSTMHLPWFMHMHGGRNTLVGVLPTPCGTYVRSWKDDFFEVIWYPMGYEFPGGQGRSTCNLGRFTDDPMRPIGGSELAVIDHMHEHPVLCMATSWDPRIEPLEWTVSAPGVSTHEADDGTWLRITSGGIVTLSVLPTDGRKQVEVARFSDACGERSLEKRIAGRIVRHREELARRFGA